MIALLWSFFFLTIPSYAETFPKAWNDFAHQYNIFLNGILGLALLTAFLVFVIHFIRFANFGNANPKAKHHMMISMLISGITTMLLGGVMIIVQILFGTAF